MWYLCKDLFGSVTVY